MNEAQTVLHERRKELEAIINLLESKKELNMINLKAIELHIEENKKALGYIWNAINLLKDESDE